jgi:hypothetical protein
MASRELDVDEEWAPALEDLGPGCHPPRAAPAPSSRRAPRAPPFAAAAPGDRVLHGGVGRPQQDDQARVQPARRCNPLTINVDLIPVRRLSQPGPTALASAFFVTHPRVLQPKGGWNPLPCAEASRSAVGHSDPEPSSFLRPLPPSRAQKLAEAVGIDTPGTFQVGSWAPILCAFVLPP